MGTVRDRLGLSPPCQQAPGLLPRGSPRTLRARLTAIPRTGSHPARVSYHNAALTLSVATATVRTNPASAPPGVSVAGTAWDGLDVRALRLPGTVSAVLDRSGDCALMAASY